MIVITGGSGRLGSALGGVFPHAARPNRAELDITKPQTIRGYLQQLESPPSVLVHAAAMTDVRLAEQDHEQCWRTNVQGTKNLVAALQEFTPKCHFVYFSTACVFQGDVGGYTEDDIPNPKNFYGLTKLVGEFVAQLMQSHLVVRTNFVAREPWPFPKAFTDRFGTYLFAEDVACGLAELIQSRQQGLVHIAGDRQMSMYELAQMTSSDVGKLTVADVDIPLTMNMSLRSVRIAPRQISEQTSTGQ
jgi:dTDP-4-dehydrorhamnose reductase